MTSKFSSTGTYLHQELQHIEENQGWWFMGKRTIIVSVVNKFKPLKKRLRILDVGCGTGFILQNLSSIGILYGIDINKRAVEICKKRGLKNVVFGDILDIPFADNFFDIVIMADVIEHIKNDTQAIKEAYRVLKRGGILFIHTPSQTIPWSQLDDAFGHVRRYSKTRLQSIIVEGELTLRKISYTNFLLYFPILFTRILQQKKKNALQLDPTGMALFPKPLEFILSRLFSFEALLLLFFNLPIGVSLLAVAQKDKDSHL